MSELIFRKIEFASDEYRLSVDLRYEILRRPLGLKFSPETLASEHSDWHLGIFEADTLKGCLILSPLSDHEIKMRQVAIAATSQGTGVGRQLVMQSEQFARNLGFEWMILNARETAVPFYLKMNYAISGKEFFEVGLPHRKMEKHLV